MNRYKNKNFNLENYFSNLFLIFLLIQESFEDNHDKFNFELLIFDYLKKNPTMNYITRLQRNEFIGEVYFKRVLFL